MKKVVLILLLFAGISCASAQEVYNSSGKPGYHKKTKKQKGYDPSKVIIGGSLNVGYSQDYANAGISAILGYKITDKFSAGIGLGYQYYQEGVYADPNNPYHEQYIKENIVYPSIWGRYFFYRNFFADATVEYDFINLQQPGYDNYGNYTTLKSDVTNTCLLLGLGYRWQLAGRVSIFFEAMYDVLQNPNSPYFQQIVPRAGICVGL